MAEVKARDIKAGTRTDWYTVLDDPVILSDGYVKLHVKYPDGGTGYREVRGDRKMPLAEAANSETA